MTPDWLNDVVGAFGRQMGLQSLRLGERDSAGVRFENDVEMKLEFSRGFLEVLLTIPIQPNADTARQVLVVAHPESRKGIKIRSGFFEKSGRAFFHARLAEREVAVDSLERVFRELWTAAGSVRRAA